MRGFAGSRLRYPAGVVVRVRGVRATLSGSCGKETGWWVRVRGTLLVLGCVIRLVWWCGCAGFGQRYLVLGCVIRLVWLCGCAGFGQRYLVRVVKKQAGGCGCAGTYWFRVALSGWYGCAGARGSGNVIWF